MSTQWAPIIHHGVYCRGRRFLIGDIHGAFDKVREALKAVAFDPAGDQLFSVGDLLDRGNCHDELLVFLEAPWFFPVLGNHELSLLAYMGDARLTGLHCCVPWLQHAAWFDALSARDQKKLYLHLKSLPVMRELQRQDGQRVGLVHADVVNGSWSISAVMMQQLSQGDISRGTQHALMTLTWSRETAHVVSHSAHLVARDRKLSSEQQNSNPAAPRVEGIDHLVVGHTVMDTVTSSGNVHCIDTGFVFRETPAVLVDSEGPRFSVR